MATENVPTEQTPAPAPEASPAPSQPPSPAGSSDTEPDDADLVAAAMKVAAGEPDPKPEPAPAPAPEPTTPPRPAAEAKSKEGKQDGGKSETQDGSGGEETIPSWEDLQAEIAQRTAQKQQAQSQQPSPPEQPEERTQAQQQAAERKADAVAAAVSVEDFKRDPVGVALKHGLNPRDLIRAFAGATFGQGQQQGEKPKQSALDPERVQQMIDERVQEVIEQHQQEREEQEREERKAAQRENAEIEFARLTADSEQFPYLSRLDDDERVWYGHRYVQAFLSAGRRPTDTEIAQAIEKDQAKRFGPAASTGSADQKNQSAAGDDENTKGPGGPKTLSQSLPAQPSSVSEPETEDELFEAAVRVAQAGG